MNRARTGLWGAWAENAQAYLDRTVWFGGTVFVNGSANPQRTC